LPPYPPKGFPIDGSAGILQVYADCSKISPDSMKEAP
jgi:hypothetical protein